MQDQALTIRSKITRYLVAPLTFLTFLNSLDRVNVSFAALQMNAQLGLSPERYGFGVGLFFFGYLACQFPHTHLLKTFGARRWIFGTVLAWGTVATCMGFVQNAMQFYVLRVLLGIAEAGFAPGIVFFMSQWMPKRFRAWAIAGSMLAIPISIVFGGPLSGLLLSANTGWAIPGWRFMFLIEGAITIVVALIAPFYFVDEPSQARWLSPEEKTWLARELARDREVAEIGAPTSAQSVGAMLRSGPIWAAAGVWFSLMSGAYGIIYWLPQMIKQLSGLSDLTVSLLSALPWLGLGTGMLLNAWHSDLTQERHWHIGLAAGLAACGIWAGASLGSGWLALTCLTIGAVGLGGAQGAFWALPTGFLDRNVAAAGVTLVNLLGSSGGLVAPPLIGFIRARTGSFTLAASALALLLVVGALLLTLIRPARSRAVDVRVAG